MTCLRSVGRFLVVIKIAFQGFFSRSLRLFNHHPTPKRHIVAGPLAAPLPEDLRHLCLLFC